MNAKNKFLKDFHELMVKYEAKIYHDIYGDIYVEFRMDEDDEWHRVKIQDSCE